MQSIEALFEDYAEHHRTAGNRTFERVGIPLILLSLLGLLSRLELLHLTVVVLDAGVLLIAFAAICYTILEWRLAIVMTVFLLILYFIGREIPQPVLWTVFVLGCLFQFVGHSVHEKRQPDFPHNLMHLFIGPLWILNDLIPVIASHGSREQRARN